MGASEGHERDSELGVGPDIERVGAERLTLVLAGRLLREPALDLSDVIADEAPRRWCRCDGHGLLAFYTIPVDFHGICVVRTADRPIRLCPSFGSCYKVHQISGQ